MEITNVYKSVIWKCIRLKLGGGNLLMSVLHNFGKTIQNLNDLQKDHKDGVVNVTGFTTSIQKRTIMTLSTLSYFKSTCFILFPGRNKLVISRSMMGRLGNLGRKILPPTLPPYPHRNFAFQVKVGKVNKKAQNKELEQQAKGHPIVYGEDEKTKEKMTLGNMSHGHIDTALSMGYLPIMLDEQANEKIFAYEKEDQKTVKEGDLIEITQLSKKVNSNEHTMYCLEQHSKIEFVKPADSTSDVTRIPELLSTPPTSNSSPSTPSSSLFSPNPSKPHE